MLSPEKHIMAIAISPTVMKVMPSPFRGSGTSLNSIFSLMAPIATMAAYREGEEWRRQMLAYIEANVCYLETYCREHLPMLRRDTDNILKNIGVFGNFKHQRRHLNCFGACSENC